MFCLGERWNFGVLIAISPIEPRISILSAKF